MPRNSQHQYPQPPESVENNFMVGQDKLTKLHLCRGQLYIFSKTLEIFGENNNRPSIIIRRNHKNLLEEKSIYLQEKQI